MARQTASLPTLADVRGLWTWTCSDVADWLRDIGLAHVTNTLSEHGVDGAALVFATEKDLT